MLIKILIFIVVVVVVCCYLLFMYIKQSKRVKYIQENGIETVGWVITCGASAMAEDMDELDGVPGFFLIPSNPKDGEDAAYMGDLCMKITDLLQGPKPTDPALVKMRKALKDDAYIEDRKVKVPKSLYDGDTLYIMDVMILKKWCPKGKFKRKYLRVAYIPDEPEMGVLHIDYEDRDTNERPARRGKASRRRDDDDEE
ncbi:MAG: hypothetical protein ACRC8S_03705 [Fimbriiglobus sp.]